MALARKVREVHRAIHLVASVMLLAYLYTPLGDNTVFSVMLRVMVVPVVALSGVLMWQWPRLRRMKRQRRIERTLRTPPVGSRGHAPARSTAR
jgi:membrane-anchored protein YejM (alkaline phosphatase superfamily)